MSLLVVNPRKSPGRAPATQTGRLVSFTLPALPGEPLEALCRRFAVRLHELAATPLHLQVFGQCRASAAFADSLRHHFSRVDWPITWAEGSPCGSQPVSGGQRVPPAFAEEIPAQPIAGLQVHAFAGNVERVVWDGRFIGSVFTDGGARQCLVGGLMPEARAVSRPDQTRHALETLQALLAQAGFELGDVVRTWFFLDQILAWYGEFNPVRTKIYSGVKFRTGSLPASTGVGARNPSGAALALAAWAFRPLGPDSYAEPVASPLQCPAPAYGSSFSRAMETSANYGRRLFVSGTASIAPSGQTLWVGDVRQQVDQTMDVVEAILRSRGFSLPDLACATAYFRHPTDAGVLAEWLAANGLSSLPVIVAQCDVCRDDLLFELEAEAAGE